MEIHFNLSVIYFANIFFPLFTIIPSTIVYFAKMGTSSITRIELFVIICHHRVFRVCIIVESILLLVFGLVQHSVVMVYFTRETNCKRRAHYLAKINNALIIFSSVLLVLIGSSPENHSWHLHNFGIYGFFTGMLVYFCIYDYVRVELRQSLGMISLVFNAIFFIALLSSALMRLIICDMNQLQMGLISATELIEFLSLVSKIFVIWKKTHLHYIRIKAK